MSNGWYPGATLLRQMSPRLSTENIAHSQVAYLIPVSKCQNISTGSVFCSDRTYLLFIEFGLRVMFSLRTSLTALRNLIALIVRMCTKEQVRRVDTRRVITLVKHPHAFRYSTDAQFKGHPMCRYGSSSYLELTVSGTSMRSEPKPATVSLVDLRPKTLFNAVIGLPPVVMPSDIANRLTSHMTEPTNALSGNGGRQTTPTLTEFGRNIVGWYSNHVLDLLHRLRATPRTFAASRGLLVPNYSTFVSPTGGNP